jgi:hypothetical protein
LFSSWWEKLWTDPNAAFAGAVALFTFALVGVGGWQARRLRQTVEAARHATAETRRIGEAQVRAYVDISKVDLTFVALSGMLNLQRVAHPLVKIEANNTGQSPARNFVWNPTLRYFTSGPNQPARVGELPANWRDILGITIPVGKPHEDQALIPNMELNQLFPASDVTKTISMLVQLRIRFEFEDVFGERIPADAFFAGIFVRMPMVADYTQPGDWVGKLERIHQPNNWDS